jgi:hypothetical protein
MSGGKGTSYKNNFLTWALTSTAVTRPTAWTVHLYTDATGATSQPTTEATTSNCPGYAAQNVTFSAPSNGSTSNSNDVAFTATGAWATINYYGISDGTNLIYWAPLSTPRTLQVSGDKLDFAIGSISVSEA